MKNLSLKYSQELEGPLCCSFIDHGAHVSTMPPRHINGSKASGAREWRAEKGERPGSEQSKGLRLYAEAWERFAAQRMFEMVLLRGTIVKGKYVG